ncbi:MAG: methyltransferase domain-containing protein [Methylophaga sp.]|nr:methyltransferase domain-containing protein [Methylophaga sp.]
MSSNISPQEYDQFKLFLEQACGIVLGEGKQYLITSRLTRLLRDEGMATIAELLSAIQRNSPRHLRDSVIDAMTTNETSWFRDRIPFECLEKSVFPEMEQDGKRQCRIWSSACSSGQEPYTISITASEYTKAVITSGFNHAQIVATDISASMLLEAKRAEYDESILGRGLSAERKQQFFKANGERWQVVDDIKRRVSFREQNLLSSYDALGKFDIIFCRNVLIYFSPERKSDILNRMAKSLNPGGYLFLGASETITGYSDAFKMVRSPQGVFYRRKD